MVEKNAEKRPSASEALSYPVFAQQLQVRVISVLMPVVVFRRSEYTY